MLATTISYFDQQKNQPTTLQAHWAGTQSQHTEANLPKELAIPYASSQLDKHHSSSTIHFG
jgi:hypothetical protein